MHIQEDLIGPRVRIRNYFNTDLEFVTDMWFDEVNGTYMSDPMREYVDEAYRSGLEDMQDHEDGYYFVIELGSTGERIGSCCAFPDSELAVYDIGYCIHKDYWKQGYGTETLSLLESWLRDCGAEKITAEVAVDNIASNMLLKKLGFEVERETEFKKYHMDVVYKSYVYQKSLGEKGKWL